MPWIDKNLSSNIRKFPKYYTYYKKFSAGCDILKQILLKKGPWRAFNKRGTLFYFETILDEEVYVDLNVDTNSWQAILGKNELNADIVENFII